MQHKGPIISGTNKKGGRGVQEDEHRVTARGGKRKEVLTEREN